MPPRPKKAPESTEQTEAIDHLTTDRQCVYGEIFEHDGKRYRVTDLSYWQDDAWQTPVEPIHE